MSVSEQSKFSDYGCFLFLREYYFSLENLQADIFLRQQMTKEGYVPLTLIANFNRVHSLCDDIYLIANVRSDSIVFLVFEKKTIRCV